MKYFSWNDEENRQLKSERNISFEEVVFHIEKGQLLDILERCDGEGDKKSHTFIVNINGSVVLVPYVVLDREIFLKTIIPISKTINDYFELRSSLENA